MFFSLFPWRATATLTAALATSTFSFAALDPVRIVPIGDSITQGRGGTTPTFSWRYPLWQMLVDAGVRHDFVGSMVGGFNSSPDWADYKGLPFDRNHEGHWGWRTDAIRDNLPNWLIHYTADIAMILLGTNDWGYDRDQLGLNAAQSALRTAGEMEEIIAILRADNPDILIFLGDPFQEWSPFPDYRLEYAALASRLSTARSPVINVAHAPGWVSNPALPGTHTVDWVHPNLSGDTKLARNWYNALFPFIAVNPTAWTEFHFPDPSAPQAALAADPDQDGLPNLLEYALTTDPNASTPADQRPRLDRVDDSLVYTFPRDPRLEWIRYRVRTSSDLLSWSTAYDSTTGTPNTHDWHHSLVFPFDPDAAFIVRLEVDHLPP